MYYAEREILSQFSDIKKTTDYVWSRKTEVEEMFSGVKRVVFIGCGSSYYIAKSAATFMNLSGNKNSISIAAGDLLINFEKYREYINGSVVVCLSRSGSTSELLFALKKMVDLDCSCVSICASINSNIEKYCKLNIVLPWAFDKSVCQTNTVSNLYFACIILIAIIIQDFGLIKELNEASDSSKQFRQRYEKILKQIGSLSWEQAVVLADCEIAGAAEEGALAFKEICQVNSNHYHILDVRHGPLVMINKKCIVILIAEKNNKFLIDLVKDIKGKGAFCLTMGMFEESIGGDEHMSLPVFNNFVVAALYILFAIQFIALNKALTTGINPDEPEGLAPFILLD